MIAEVVLIFAEVILMFAEVVQIFAADGRDEDLADPAGVMDEGLQVRIARSAQLGGNAGNMALWRVRSCFLVARLLRLLIIIGGGGLLEE